MLLKHVIEQHQVTNWHHSQLAPSPRPVESGEVGFRVLIPRVERHCATW